MLGVCCRWVVSRPAPPGCQCRAVCLSLSLSLQYCTHTTLHYTSATPPPPPTTVLPGIPYSFEPIEEARCRFFTMNRNSPGSSYWTGSTDTSLCTAETAPFHRLMFLTSRQLRNVRQERSPVPQWAGCPARHLTRKWVTAQHFAPFRRERRNTAERDHAGQIDEKAVGSLC